MSDPTPDKDALIKAMMQYKKSADMIQDLITILNTGQYPLSILDKVPTVVAYIHELKKGTHEQIEKIEKQLS